MRLFRKRVETADQRATAGRRPPGRNTAGQRAQAFSYHAQRSGSSENIGRSTEHIVDRQTEAGPVRQTLWKRWQFGLGLLVILGAACYFSIVSPEPRIVAVASGDSAYFLQDEAAYGQTVRRTLLGSVLNRFKPTVQTSAIQSDLQRNYPEVSQVSVVKPIFSKHLTVRITPSQPSFILTTTDSKAFLLDRSGRALISASQISDSGELSVPTLHDNSGLSVRLGSQALPRSIVTFATTVTDVLKSKNLRVSSMSLPPASSELHVSLEGVRYIVKLNLQDDPLQQTGAFLAAKGRLDRDRTMPASYIDVRVPERAYYK